MIKLFKIYASDAITNLAAQLLLLFAGYLSLIFSNYAVFGWGALVLGYSFVLAKMWNICEQKKGADFKHYILCVLLPPNIAALAVSCCCFAVAASVPSLGQNTTVGLVVLIGSAAITLGTVFCNRVVLR